MGQVSYPYFPHDFTLCRTRSWYASQVIGLLDLPQTLQKLLGSNPSGSVVVRRFHYNDFKVIKPGRLDALGENRIDRKRATVSQDIGVGYDVALATLNGDI